MSHIPEKEAEMKGRCSWGKTGLGNRGAIVPRTDRALHEAAARTAALCRNVIKGPVGANVWNPLTPRRSHTTAEPVRAAVTGSGPRASGQRG